MTSSIIPTKRWMPNDKNLAELYNISKKIKDSGIQDTIGKYSTPFFMNGYAQLSFITSGCNLGQCCFCTYGAANHELKPQIVTNEMEKFIKQIESYDKPIYSVLFDSIGSILDPSEFSSQCLDAVFAKLDDLFMRVPTISDIAFETHYQTLGSFDENGNYIASNAINKLIDFKKQHPNIDTFIIELGFESENSELRDHLLFKHIDNDTYKQSIEYLHQNGINVDVNIMATLPFLSKQEQINNSTYSIIEALKPFKDNGFGANNVILFPLNIRENTFCDYVFKSTDKYQKANPKFNRPNWLDTNFPIWSLVATLKNLIDLGYEDLLSQVSVAWFGNHTIRKTDIEPTDWQYTYDAFVEYRKNLEGKNNRVNIIKQLSQHPKFIEYMQQVENEIQPTLNFAERSSMIHEIIKQTQLPVKSCFTQPTNE